MRASLHSPVRTATAAFLTSAALAVAHPAAVQAQSKLAYVEVGTVLEAVPGRAEAQQTLEREGQAIQAEITRMNDSLNALGTAYQKAQPTLTPAQRQTREREFQARQQEYQQRFQALQERGARRQQELAGTFETVVRQAIDEVRTTGGYTMIFASGPNSPMLSADRGLDVTDQVVARVKTISASRPATPSATPAAAATAPAPAGAAPAPAGATRPADHAVTGGDLRRDSTPRGPGPRPG